MTLFEQVSAELRAIVSSFAILFGLVGGSLIYAIVYPQPYVKEVPQEQKVAVLNLDGSKLSRTLIRMVDATSQVKVERSYRNLEEIETALKMGQIVGYLIIPEDFYRDVMLRRSPAISYAGDGSYYLAFGTISQGIVAASSTLGVQIEVKRQALEGKPFLVAAQRHSDIRLYSRPVFNPTFGYITYVVAGVLVLVLHQLLIIASGMLGCRQMEVTCRHCAQHPKDKLTEDSSCTHHLYWCYLPVWRIVIGRLISFMLIATPMAAAYFGVVFGVYDIPHVADFKQLCLFCVPFFMATIAFGMVIGEVLRRPEIVNLLVVFSSMPLIFGSGIIWPTELIPGWLNSFLQWIPATNGIMGLVELNQMGAELSAIQERWMQLWKLVFIYSGVAYVLMRRRRFIDSEHANCGSEHTNCGSEQAS